MEPLVTGTAFDHRIHLHRIEELLVSCLKLPLVYEKQCWKDWRFCEEGMSKKEWGDIEISKLEGCVIGKQLLRW